MARGAAEVHEMLEAAEVERPDHVGRAQHAHPVHAEQEIPLRVLGLEEVVEDVALEAVARLPEMDSLADRGLQVAPHPVPHAIGVVDIADERLRARPDEIGGRHGEIRIDTVVLGQELHADAGIEQPLGRIGMELELPGQFLDARRGSSKALEDPQFEGGEHRLGSTEAVE